MFYNLLSGIGSDFSKDRFYESRLYLFKWFKIILCEHENDVYAEV